MYENSSSQVFRMTTGIQSGPDAFDKSGLVITVLTIQMLGKGVQLKTTSLLVFLLLLVKSLKNL